MRATRRWWRRPAIQLGLAAAAGTAVLALALLQPWKLWVDQTVNEALPATAATTAVPPVGTSGPIATTSPPIEPVVLARGTFVSHEHATTGGVRVLQGADGVRYLRLDDLDTSNGPLLEVWLTDAPVVSGSAGWYLFDDGRHVSLGALKGNRGSQNYALPADLDLSQYRSVSIWCARFDVSFGAAELTA